MKMSYRTLIIVAFATVSVGCAHGQGGGGAGGGALPADAPANNKSAPRVTQRARTVVGTTPYAQIESAAEQYQNAVGRFGGSYGFSSSRSSSDSVPPVVIQFGAKDGNAISAMEEDLAIMTLIIDRALDRMGEDGVDEKFGVKLYYTSGGRSVRALYLDGFGPLFMVKVNFPVHAAMTTATKAPEQQDSEWEIVRRTLNGGGPEVQWSTSSSAVPYDAARVDVLKKNLLHALKNASNMKGVRGDEYVNVSVFGSPVATGGESGFSAEEGIPGAANTLAAAARADKRDPAAGFGSSSQRSRNLEVARASLQGTVLTLRVKKSDIDAAAKGGLDDEAFAKKVAVNTYTGNGYGLTSVNSWIRKSSSSSSAVAR